MATQSNNFILIEKDASSPIRGQQRSIDAADDIVLAPATVSIQPTGNVAINSTSGTLSMGDAASTQAINIGTNGARVITLGQGIGTGPTIILNGTTNTTTIEAVGSLSIGSTYTGTETVNFASASGGALGFQRTLNIGSTNASSSTNIYSGSGGTNVFGLFQVASTTNAIFLTSTSGAITIDGTTTGTIGIGTAGGTGIISIGTAATNRAITIGNATNTSALRLDAGSGGILLTTNATAGTIGIGADGGTGQISIGTGTGTRAISIASGANDGAVNIATSANLGRATTIGNSTGTSSLSLQAGTGALNIGTAATNKAITIGQTANTSYLALNGGTGGITLSVGATAGVIALTGTSTGFIGIGSDTGTGTISIGSSTGARQIDIGNGATSTATVNIVGSSATGARTVNIGTGGTGAKTVVIGENTIAGSTTTINGGTTGGVNIATANVAVPVNIATGSTAGTVSIGTGSAAHTLAFGTGLGNKTVQVGSTSGTSGTTIQAGTTGIALTAGSSAGPITIGGDAGTGGIAIAGTAATGVRNIFIGTGGTGAKTVSIGNSSVAGSSTSITGGSTGGVQINLDTNSPISIATGTSTGQVSVATGATTQTVKIADGLGAKTVTVGSYSLTSTTTIQGGLTGRVRVGATGGAIFGSTQPSFNDPSPVGIRALNYPAGSALAQGDIVVSDTGADQADGAPIVVKANATTAGKQGFLGVALESISTSTFGDFASVSGTVAQVKFKSGAGNVPTATDAGKPVYLSDSDGLASMLAPSASGSRVFIIGYLVRTSVSTAGLYYVQLMPQFIADIP